MHNAIFIRHKPIPLYQDVELYHQVSKPSFGILPDPNGASSSYDTPPSAQHNHTPDETLNQMDEVVVVPLGSEVVQHQAEFAAHYPPVVGLALPAHLLGGSAPTRRMC